MNATKESAQLDEIKRSVLAVSEGVPGQLEKVAVITAEMATMLLPDMSQQQHEELMIQVALQNVKDDPDYDQIAARLLLRQIYRNIVGPYESPQELRERHAVAFPKFIEDAVAQGLLDKRMNDGRFDIKRLAEALDPARDDLSKYLGVVTNRNRYALRKQNGEPLETPQFTHMRIAMGMSLQAENPTKAALEFYEHMSNLDYVRVGLLG